MPLCVGDESEFREQLVRVVPYVFGKLFQGFSAKVCELFVYLYACLLYTSDAADEL